MEKNSAGSRRDEEAQRGASIEETFGSDSTITLRILSDLNRYNAVKLIQQIRSMHQDEQAKIVLDFSSSTGVYILGVAELALRARKMGLLRRLTVIGASPGIDDLFRNLSRDLPSELGPLEFPDGMIEQFHPVV